MPKGAKALKKKFFFLGDFEFKEKNFVKKKQQQVKRSGQ